MAREPMEVHCSNRSGCGGWFIVNLNMAVRGDYILVCPNCGREHARTIRDGAMKSNDQEARFVGGVGKIDIVHVGGGGKPGWERILPMKSAYSKTPRLELVKIVPCGYMNETWMRKAAAEKGAIDPLDEKVD